MRKWRIYYEDGTVFTNEDGSPWDAPRVGVQLIAQPNKDVGWYFLHSGDSYYWEEEREGWGVANDFTKFDHLIRAHNPLLIFGRQISDPMYKKVVDKARADLPTPKTGCLISER